MRVLFFAGLLVVYTVAMAFAFAAFDFFSIDAGVQQYAWFGDYRFVFSDAVSWLSPLGFGMAEHVYYLYARWFHGWTGYWLNPVGDWTWDWGDTFYPMWKWYLSYGVRQVFWLAAVIGLWGWYGNKRRTGKGQGGTGKTA